MYRPESDQKAENERLTSDKASSVYRLVFKTRAMQFDAFLKQAPTSDELTALARRLGKPQINHVLFDADGTLVPPYAPITDEVVRLLMGYRDQGRNVAVYSSSAPTDRFRPLRENGIPLATTCASKPSLAGFKYVCAQQKMAPAHTAMIGNFPVTDMPLVEDGEKPFFPLNVLVESIPPRRELLESWVQYFRARAFDAMSRAAAGIVIWRNPGIVRDIQL